MNEVAPEGKCPADEPGDRGFDRGERQSGGAEKSEHPGPAQFFDHGNGTDTLCH